MNRLLRIPNWLLFILIITIPNLFQETDYGIYIHIIFGLLLVFWMIKVGEEMHIRIDGKTSLNLNLYVAGLFFAVTYFSLIFLLTDGYSISTEKDNFAEYGNLTYVYTAGHLISFLAFLYGLHFTASCIQTLDKQLFGNKTSYNLLLASLFFFPIWIWWTQPKINRILKTPVEV